MARLKANIQDLETAREFLGTAEERKLGHNTVAHRYYSMSPKGGAVAVFLHLTRIVTYYVDGRVRLDSGGGQTVTTADRIRQLLPPGFYLQSRKGEWFIVDNRPTHRNPDREARFTDGMVIDTTTEGNPFADERRY